MDLTADLFEGLLHERFAVATSPDRRVEIELIQVVRGTPAPRTEHFSVLFQVPAETFSAQATYRLEHPAVGEVALFLVPVGMSADGLLFEAAFNRLTSPSNAGGDA